MTKAVVITLPRLLGSRESARKLVQKHVTNDCQYVVLNAFEQESTSQGASDELVRNLLKSNVDRVIVVNATSRLRSHLTNSHQRRTNDNNYFVLFFQDRDEEVMLRSV